MKAQSHQPSDTQSSSASSEATRESRPLPSSKEQTLQPPGMALTTIKLAFIIVAIHIIGILFGFTLFYTIFRTECANKLSHVANQSNASLALLERRHRMESEHLVQEETVLVKKEHLLHQKACLEQQTALTAKHQECLLSHDNTLSRVLVLQEQDVASRALIHNLSASVEQLRDQHTQCEANIHASVQNSEQLRIRMQNQLDLAKAMMHEKVNEVERLKSLTDDTYGSSPQCGVADDKVMIQMQADIRRRSAVMVTQTFGAPPYVVVFVVRTSNKPSSSFSFEIELSSLNEMPHTIYTFLSLVQAGLYLGTSMQRKQDTKVLVGGHPSSCTQKQVQSKLMRQYAELGFNAADPLLFTERSTRPCGTEKGFGLRNRGPDLELWLWDEEHNETAHPHTCPGRIVSGYESLVQYAQDASKREPLSIVDVRIVSEAKKSVP
jgi:cyclophilin family peptidyl-prolyl cis-trans isomerase